MFSYFGSKYWLVKYYPPPRYNLIIEPFAGSAQYAFRYADHKVILIEKNEHVVRLWKWLQKAKPKDILKLPLFNPGDEIKYHIPEARDLIAMSMNPGTTPPGRNYAGSFYNLRQSWERKRNKIAASLDAIRHWNILLGDYREIRNYNATWFIDPPYQNKPRNYHQYRIQDEDYTELASWSRSRKGQAIVCEHEGANWLPFRALHTSGQSQTNRPQKETIWTNDRIQLRNVTQK